MSAPMQLQTFTEIPGDPRFRDEWNQLVYAMESPEVFYTWEWSTAVSRSYRACVKPLLIAAFRESALAGVVALNLSGDGSASFLTADTADYCDFISRREDRAEFVALVFKELRKIGVVDVQLASLPAHSSTVPALRGCGYKMFSRPAYLCRQIQLNSDHARREVKESAERRHRRILKRLRPLGAVKVAHERPVQVQAAELEQLAIAQIGRFLAENRLSNLISSERRSFLAELGDLLGSQGWLALSKVKLGDSTVAWNFGMVFAGKWFWYQPAFDFKRKDAGVGSLLLCDILQTAARDSDVHTIDLGLGDETYKQRYAKSGAQTLHIFATRSAARLGWSAARYYSAAVIRKSPRLESLARKTLARISNFAGQRAGESLLHALSRLKRTLRLHTETRFFEWLPGTPTAASISHPLSSAALQPLSLDILARAAMQYPGDDETIKYLLRCANRMNTGQAQGFALVGSDDTPVHFCWTKPFESCWIAGIRSRLKEPAPNSALVFDCWTPVSQRGRGYYQQGISLAASKLLEEGATPWIFTDPHNTGSLRGILSAGFVPRFSLVNKKLLTISRVSRVEFETIQPGALGPATAA